MITTPTSRMASSWQSFKLTEFRFSKMLFTVARLQITDGVDQI